MKKSLTVIIRQWLNLTNSQNSPPMKFSPQQNLSTLTALAAFTIFVSACAPQNNNTELAKKVDALEARAKASEQSMAELKNTLNGIPIPYQMHIGTGTISQGETSTTIYFATPPTAQGKMWFTSTPTVVITPLSGSGTTGFVVKEVTSQSATVSTLNSIPLQSASPQGTFTWLAIDQDWRDFNNPPSPRKHGDKPM